MVNVEKVTSTTLNKNIKKIQYSDNRLKSTKNNQYKRKTLTSGSIYSYYFVKRIHKSQVPFVKKNPANLKDTILNDL